MNISLEEILNWDSKYRLRFINSLSGYKGAHLIGTKDDVGMDNLGVFNSLMHISSQPPRIGFIMRPLTVKRQTYDNIIATGSFTINHIHESFVQQAHYTSAKAPKEVSEFDLCELTAQRLEGFPAPFVQESKIKIGLNLVEEVVIQSNNSRLMIGEIQHVLIDNEVVESDGQLDLSVARDICVTGLNQYSKVIKHTQLPYARLSEVPNFKSKERPDQVVFDEDTHRYHAHVLAYGSHIGAPKISPVGVSTWKNTSIQHFNHTFKNKVDELKKSFSELLSEYEINESIYGAKMNFEPIVGQIYHLYANDQDHNPFLSLIPPHSWGKKHLGSYQLNHEKVWKKTTPQ